MTIHKLFKWHWRAAAMVVGDDFCGMGETADDARRFPAGLRIFLHHYADIKAPLLMAKQEDPPLDEVAFAYLIAIKAVVQLVEGSERANAGFNLVSEASARSGILLDPNDSFSKGAVDGFHINHAVLGEHCEQIFFAEQLGSRHVLAQMFGAQEHLRFSPFASNALYRQA